MLNKCWYQQESVFTVFVSSYSWGRLSWYHIHWRCSTRASKNSPHSQVFLSIWILFGA